MKIDERPSTPKCYLRQAHLGCTLYSSRGGEGGETLGVLYDLSLSPLHTVGVE